MPFPDSTGVLRWLTSQVCRCGCQSRRKCRVFGDAASSENINSDCEMGVGNAECEISTRCFQVRCDCSLRQPDLTEEREWQRI